VGANSNASDTHRLNALFHHHRVTNYKKNAKKAEAALIAGDPAPRPVYLPFPAWLETKNRIAAQLEDTRKNFGDRSREWEEKEQVGSASSSVMFPQLLMLRCHSNDPCRLVLHLFHNLDVALPNLQLFS
jgi:hypothetical protein